MGYFEKLKSRTEWQAYLITAVTIFVNRFFDIGLTEADLWTLVGLSAGYGGSRGLAKMGREPSGGSAPAASVSAPEEKPSEGALEKEEKEENEDG